MLCPRKDLLQMMLILILSYSSILPAILQQDSLDLEQTQEIVLETKQIILPETQYLRFWNPSIVRWNGKLLLVCRKQHLDFILEPSICFVWLDEDFNPISKLQTLRIPNTLFKPFDPRLIVVDNRLFMIVAIQKCKTPKTINQRICRMFLTEIHTNGETLTADPAECLEFFEGVQKNRHEKNWVPFEYQKNLLLGYSLTPHRILQPIGQDTCKTVASTLGNVHWPWGELRGGTPALLDGDHYLAIFHSSIFIPDPQSKRGIQHYFMGAYTFSSQPPFEIKSISPEPIIGPNFYTGPFHLKRVVFPTGLLVDDDFVWVFYGKNDTEIWVAKLDKQALLHTLIPVNTPSAEENID